MTGLREYTLLKRHDAAEEEASPWDEERGFAEFIALTPALAATEIDQRWWREPPGSTEGTAEEDNHWPWAILCDQSRMGDFWEATGLLTRDGRLQGAIIYRADAESILVPGRVAVYVDRLATAPWNRPWVTKSPVFHGVGSELLLQSVHHSHLLGLSGRLMLSSLPGSVSFYTGKGFIETGRDFEDLPVLELPGESARKWLLEKGLVGHGSQG